MQWHTAARNVDAVATKKLLRCEAIEESCEKYAREASTAERIVEQERLIFEQEQKRCLAERDVLWSAMNELDADLDDMWWMVCAVYGVDEARWRMGASGFAVRAARPLPKAPWGAGFARGNLGVAIRREARWGPGFPGSWGETAT